MKRPKERIALAVGRTARAIWIPVLTKKLPKLVNRGPQLGALPGRLAKHFRNLEVFRQTAGLDLAVQNPAEADARPPLWRSSLAVFEGKLVVVLHLRHQ